MVAGGLGCTPGVPRGAPSAAERIRYYSGRVRERPNLYPAYAHLGSAYLDEARATLDPASIAKARAALARSLALQSNFAALKAMAALGNFTHRFRDGAAWGEQAAATYPADTEVTALRVEAHLGLGERDQAAALLDAAGAGAPLDFHLAVARGLWLVESAAVAEAAAAFMRAAALARAGGGDDLVVWAEVSAAGVWIDAGKPERAAPHLDQARRLRPHDRRLRLHQAELLAARGALAAALVTYEALVAGVNDPEVHRRAALLARDLGRARDAETHFAAATAGFQRALAAGEIYTLEGLARLYADHRVHAAEAVSLSARNLTYKRDRHALATDAYVRAAFGAGGSASMDGSP